MTAIGSTQASIKLSGFDNDMGSKRIFNVATPPASTDAATKAYVDLLKADVEKLKTDYANLVESVTQHVVQLFTAKSIVSTRLRVDVHVDSYVNFCSVSIYWIFDFDYIIQYFQVDLINSVGMAEFWNLDPTRTYVVDLYAEDKDSKSKRFRRAGYPNGQGVVVSEDY